MLNWSKERQSKVAVVGVGQGISYTSLTVEEQAYIERYIRENEKHRQWGSIETVVYEGKDGFQYFILLGQEGGEEKDGYATFRLVKKVIQEGIKRSFMTMDILLDTMTIESAIWLDGVLDRNVNWTRKTKNKKEVVEEIIFVTEKVEAMVTETQQWEKIYDGVNLAKELVNRPPNEVTPREMAYQALALNSYKGMYCTVLNQEDILQYKMNGILSVAKGSAEEAKLIIIEYTGNEGAKEKLGLVGKGVTFDSGGLSLKTSAYMKTMKTDMAGAAAVLGAMKTLGELQYPINVVAVLPCVENMPSGTSYKVDDIITMYDGTTVEIDNTDAEGRLILGDAVSYIQEYGVTRMIDVATLTGACETALGSVRAGAVTNHPVWGRVVCEAGEAVRERVWPFPSDEEYKEMIIGKQGDLRNAPGPKGGAVTAGYFIGAFIPSTLPWVHLDIAGTAYREQADEAGQLGATGFGVKLLWKVMHDLV